MANKGSRIKSVIATTEKKLVDLYDGAGRANPVNSDIERSLKSMAYERIKEIVEEEI